jgi:hypothetical protein
MHTSIVDQVVDFYYTLFNRVFSETFQPRIADRLKRNAVIRQVDESADAASQSLTRFFLNEQLTEQQVDRVLNGFARLRDLLKLADVANPNVTPEAVVEALLPQLPCPEAVRQADHEAVYRVALHSVIQVLMLVGPVMAAWQKLNFSTTFELPRRVVNRLNQISEQLDALGRAGEAAADERYELSYRDYLLQRFHRVEAGTVRMTTNLDVDLRELFVMPRLLERPLLAVTESAKLTDIATLMNLAAARKFFGGRFKRDKDTEQKEKKDVGIPALDQIKKNSRLVIVGVPGSGKSTFLEWLQQKLAAVEEELVMARKQAIPLLLRVRQLDPLNLPRGAALIEKATVSKDRAALMPAGWMDRQMKAGRVLFMLDGLDETEPDLLDRYVLPWLLKICQDYPDCRYLISSRPVGYPPGTLHALKFAEFDLLDFEEPEISEYTRHWCTAIRLARNEPAEEARREGIVDGDRIVAGFEDHPYIRNLARNPLMLSAICLVNYFEGGQLAKDRAVLYKLCVEGLLHHWDQRRGIHSEFGLEEKLRVCREVALAMQVDDRAEYEADKVQEIFAKVLGDLARAKKLLEHIRYRTGLLLERRPGVFALAHLTFQEYLAARAVHEGNRLGINIDRLAKEHTDGRWQEVIPLYCGLAPAPADRDMIERLIAQRDTLALSTVLTEAYLSTSPELLQDQKLRQRVLERIAIAPTNESDGNLMRFPSEEVAPIANHSIGKLKSELSVSESMYWFRDHQELLDITVLSARLREWQRMKPVQVTELIFLLHAFGPEHILAEMALDTSMYAASGLKFENGEYFNLQAEIALAALAIRQIDATASSSGVNAALLQILHILLISEKFTFWIVFNDTGTSSLKNLSTLPPPEDISTWPEFASLARRLAERFAEIKDTELERETVKLEARDPTVAALNFWADSLDRAIAEREKQQTQSKEKSKTKVKRTTKKDKN